MVPVQKWWQIPYFWGGCKAYDLLAGSEGIESSYFLTKSKAIDAFPMLKRDDVIGAMVYYGTFLLFFFFCFQLPWLCGEQSGWQIDPI